VGAVVLIVKSELLMYTTVSLAVQMLPPYSAALELNSLAEIAIELLSSAYTAPPN
jgi:hypothetical protein